MISRYARLARGGLLCLGFAAAGWLQAQPTPVLDLVDFLALVEQHNPELAAAGQQRAFAQAEVQIAGAYPNPELEVGSGPWRSRAGSGTGSATVYQITQPIELPSVRSARIGAATVLHVPGEATALALPDLPWMERLAAMGEPLLVGLLLVAAVGVSVAVWAVIVAVEVSQLWPLLVKE